MSLKDTLHNVKGREDIRRDTRIAFVTELVTWARTAPDEIFASNDDKEDVFNRLAPIFAPWESLLHRKAAMCELLYCLGCFESSLNWKEGVDKTNATSMRLITGQETGIFQVSFDSLGLDCVDGSPDDLHQCVKSYIGEPISVQRFIDAMKAHHRFALEYGARLLRNSFYWDGPIKRHEIDSSLKRDAVTEYQILLA